MRRKLWQRLVVWFGLRYDVWPWWWFDASDVTWTSVTGEKLLGLAVDDDYFPIVPHGGDITFVPDPEASDE